MSPAQHKVPLSSVAVPFASLLTMPRFYTSRTSFAANAPSTLSRHGCFVRDCWIKRRAAELRNRAFYDILVLFPLEVQVL